MINRKQRGVGLVEILVAVVIISIGFLAAASMQIQGMRFSQGAYFRSQAYFMASDIIDRMRNNPRAVTAGLYDDKVISPTAANPNCGNGNCNFQDMVDQDIFDWSSAIHNLNGNSNFVPALPSGPNVAAGGKIELVTPDQYRITLTWAENVNGSNQAQTLVVNFAAQRWGI